MLPYPTSLSLQYTSVHNTWSHYDGKYQGFNIWPLTTQHHYNDDTFNPQQPLLRGQATNVSTDDGPANIEYIQEASFSPCGRLISSPFGHGVRILSYDERISDYRTHIAERNASANDRRTVRSCQLISPQPFNNVVECFGHKSIVLSCCFSPTHMQVATGSLGGKIIIHDPVLW